MPREGNRWWCLDVAIGLVSRAAVGQQLVDEAAILQSPKQGWLTYGGNYAERHFSPLDQINPSNIDRLSRHAYSENWILTANP